ncbi:MAG: glutamate racemase [Nitriliruptorales bacterium]
MDDRAIGVFDSGLGGLTIVRALADLLPSERLVYFGDAARFPYGSKSPEQLKEYSEEIVEVLLAHDVKMIVVACNSAASAALTDLRERYHVPIIGVIGPGVRAALKISRGRLGVIGTDATISSGAYERAVEATRADAELFCQACPRFVELVEDGNLDSPEAYGLVARTLAPLRLAEVDTLVLGCTHYPHLARTIADVMGRDVTLVSSAEETAFEVRSILETTGLGRADDVATPLHLFLTTGDEQRFESLGARFLGPNLGPVERWRWAQPAV